MARTIWRRLPEEEKRSIKDRISKNKRYLWGAGLLSVSGGCYYYYSHLEVVPLTQRRRFMMYRREDIHRLLVLENENYIHEFVSPESILPPDHPTYQLTKRVFANVLHSNRWCKELNNIESWRLFVAEGDDIVNAVSLPTGDIILFTGMIKSCRNHDELGLIIGHEVAHVVLNHGSETLSHTGLLSFLGLFVIATIWFIIPSDVLSLFLHKAFNGSTKVLLEYPYSQRIEYEADRVGLMFASKACYNPDNSVNIWEHLPELGGEEYLSTHPCNKKRLDQLTAILPTACQLYNESNCKRTASKFKEWFQGYFKSRE